MKMEKIDIGTFEKVSSEITDVIQKFTDQMESAEQARLLREGLVKIHGVVASSKEVEPKPLFLPQELNELITEAIIAYYGAKGRI